MLNDVVIVGAGPVGATLALALAGGDLDVVALDARARDTPARGDRSLALSHGARLIFERLGVWSEVAAVPGAVTAIAAVDVSQRGGFGAARLDAREQGVPALGYVVSYRALQATLDAGLARAGLSTEHGVNVTKVDATPAYARIRGERDGAVREWTARVAAIADGGGDLVPGNARHRHDYGQVALVAKLWLAEPHRGIAYERFTPEGPMALLPEGDHYGLVWTTTPQQGEALAAMPEDEFLAALTARFGARVGGFLRSDDRRTFPLTLEFARGVTGARTVLLGNAAQALHPVAGQGFNLGVRDAYELAQALLAMPRDQIGTGGRLAEYARRRLADRWAGIAFTHGLLGMFGSDAALLRWPRGLALTLVDAVPPLKRIFAHAMLYGLH
ncbi:MAG: FAD-dependent monooxygenase [Burkholderiales bacterium]|jgi:2-octaprenyl-6-methoxyphenol hydroxylase